MKEFKFDHANKSWDRYRAFHNQHLGIVEFETGELMVRSCDTDDRRMYDKYGIQIVTSTDSDCPPLYLDKECNEPCPKAWLNQGGYTALAIDHEQKVAFQLHHPNSGYRVNPHRLPHLGSHVNNALGYWGGAERIRIRNGKTELEQPNPEWRKKVCPVLLSEVLPAITAMHRLAEKKNWYESGKYPAKESWLDSSASEIIDDILTTPVNHWQTELGENAKLDVIHRIATHGFNNPRSTSYVDFLYIYGGQGDLFNNKGEE